jgi:hypothetical protein
MEENTSTMPGQLLNFTPTACTDDEIAALALQIEDIHLFDETKKRKYKLDSIPDSEIAFADYLAEVERLLQFLRDLKLAHSIANAVGSDASILDEILRAETQARGDRQVAFAMSTGEGDPEAPPPYAELACQNSAEGERDLISRLATEGFHYDEPNVTAGPSGHYVQKQGDLLESLAQRASQCIACTEKFRYTQVTRLQCGHQYCGTCLREFLLRGIIDHDLALIPPRCCGTPVARQIISDTLNEKEKTEFEDAEIEKETRDKTYCSNATCGKFIRPLHVVPGNSTCPHCGHDTCALCKNPAHNDDCPADPALRATLDLGDDNHWQRCFSCRSLVAIEWGCNHMTYVQYPKT